MFAANDNGAESAKASTARSVRRLPDKGSAGAISDGPEPSTDNSCGNEWFINIAKSLYVKDAGLQIHLATGADERSCYRYAAGHSRVPGYVIYLALRSNHGWQWISAFMDGCAADWWKQLQLDRKQASAARAFVRGMESQ